MYVTRACPHARRGCRAAWLTALVGVRHLLVGDPSVRALVKDRCGAELFCGG